MAVPASSRACCTRKVRSPARAPHPHPPPFSRTGTAGRVLWEMFAWAHPAPAADAGARVLLDCDREALSAIIKRLHFCRLRADVDISDVSDEWSACAVLGALSLSNSPLPGLPGHHPSSPSVVVPDPRCALLGSRAIIHNELAGSVTPTVDAAAYHGLRRRLGIAEGVSEVTPDKYFPSELNLEWLGGVSFTKGCYAGQELTARTHFQGQVRKRVLPCFASGDALAPPESSESEAEDLCKVHLMDGNGELLGGRKGAAGLLLGEGGGARTRTLSPGSRPSMSAGTDPQTAHSGPS